MKALTLYQPFATLLAHGLKQYETRPWKTSYRGWFAIHAGKEFPNLYAKLVDTDPFNLLLAKVPNLETLPLGAVLGIAYLDDCIPSAKLTGKLTEVERVVGDFTDGRFGFRITKAIPFPDPMPWRGSQMFWEWTGLERFRTDLGRRLGLTLSNPWLWELQPDEVIRYWIAAKEERFGDIPLPIATAPNGLPVLGEPR